MGIIILVLLLLVDSHIPKHEASKFIERSISTRVVKVSVVVLVFPMPLKAVLRQNANSSHSMLATD